jgi:small subunit ribosomal protein S2
VAQEVGIKELLEAGVHFGHQTRRWNPKMRRFIYGERAGNYIIDLTRTEQLLGQAQRFADGLARRGGTVLFVGTKKQARDGIKEFAEAAGQPYVNHRWLGGLLTNFQTISLRIKRLHDLERYESEGQLGLLPTRERLAAQADLEKLRANLGGVKNMQRVPDALFVIDLKTEAIAVREAQRLRIPIIGLVDTNCDPDGIDFVIPGNDDAIRACNIITRAIGDVIQTGNRTFREEEERARREAEEQSRREAEEKARREAEEQARKEAEEAALTQTEAETRDAADATVAQAVQDLGLPQPEGTGDAEAAAAEQAADEPAMPAGGPGERATAREHAHPEGDHERQPVGGASGGPVPAEVGPSEPSAEEAPAEPAAEAAPAESVPEVAAAELASEAQVAEPAAEPAPVEPAAEAAPVEAPAEPAAEAAAPAEPAAEAAAAEPAAEEPAAESAPAEAAAESAAAEPAAEAAAAEAAAQAAPAEPAAEAAPVEAKKPARKPRSRAKKKDAPGDGEAAPDETKTETQETK